MGRKKRTKGPAKGHKPINPRRAEESELYVSTETDNALPFLPMRDRTREFGHYGCKHRTTKKWWRGGRSWCSPCYTMRWGVHPAVDPHLEQPPPRLTSD